VKALIDRFRLAAVLVAAFAVVLVDSVSRVLSMCADLVFIAIVLALVWGPLTRKDRKP